MKTNNDNLGFGLIGVLVILVILASIGGIGWYVYLKNSKQNSSQQNAQKSITNFDECVAAGNPVMESDPEQCSANGQTFTRATQQESLKPYEATSEEIPFNNLPDGLKQAITTKLSDYCTKAELANSEVAYSYAVAAKDSYVANKYAQVTLTCGGPASAGLFAIRDNKWHYVASTQDVWPCDALVKYKIPISYISECFNEVGESAVPNPVKL